jgi:uncharacterized membrane protein HdeD (DUF308 family)
MRHVFLGGVPATIGQGNQFTKIWAVIALAAAAAFTVSFIALVLLLRKKLHASVWLGSLALIVGAAKMLYDITSKQ